MPVGPNSLLLAGLAVRRADTGDPVHDDLMRGTGRFLLGQQQSDGVIFDSWRSGAPFRHTASTGPGKRRGRSPFSNGSSPAKAGGEAADSLSTTWQRAGTGVEGRLSRLPITGRHTQSPNFLCC